MGQLYSPRCQWAGPGLILAGMGVGPDRLRRSRPTTICNGSKSFDANDDERRAPRGIQTLVRLINRQGGAPARFSFTEDGKGSSSAASGDSSTAGEAREAVVEILRQRGGS